MLSCCAFASLVLFSVILAGYHVQNMIIILQGEKCGDDSAAGREKELSDKL